jgi:hypothetical protein|tara:strand:+ start:359 stop:565 length:207 start_codon:yes stop_codon:yes gene_type:complete
MLFTNKQLNTGSWLDNIFNFKHLSINKETTETMKTAGGSSFWRHVSVQLCPAFETIILIKYYNKFHAY